MSMPSAFEQLDRRLQRWIWRQGWPGLRPVQEEAVAAILPADADVLIAAATAGGKTEAAFLPVLSAVAGRGDHDGNPGGGPGIQVLALSPLKALINDQHRRLEELAEVVGMRCHRWHGDVPGARKSALLKHPEGILYITPESLEALFVRHGTGLRRLFGALAFVVVDELHAFIGSVRGKQLQSLLHRVERVAGRTIPRVALSATLGDMQLAATFLRPDGALPCRLLEAAGGERTLLLQLKGVEVRAPRLDNLSREEKAKARDEAENEAVTNIARHLYATLRGTHNMVFANAKRDVEALADALRMESLAARVPNEFFPHHGSLSKEFREDAEARLRDKQRPATAVCTNTLELGIDVGSVTGIVQMECPPSVAALRQRLGRSGRRQGEPSILRAFCREEAITSTSTLRDRLRGGLVQACAMLELLLQHWYEPPDLERLHLSTLVQQLLSAIAQHGGLTAMAAWKLLCAEGPFHQLTQGQFVSLLRALGEQEILAQAGDGALLPGAFGEKLINHYTFYAAFSTPEEYRLEHNGKTVGMLPVISVVRPNDFLIFAGRRWLVLDVDAERKVISLKRASSGRAPAFLGDGFIIHDRVVETIRLCYGMPEPPRYLDATGRHLFLQGQATFQDLGLVSQQVVVQPSGVTLFPWAGTLALQTLRMLLQDQGLKVEELRIALDVLAPPEAVREALAHLAAQTTVDPIALAAGVPLKAREKYDAFLGEALLNVEFASRALRIPKALALARTLADDTGWAKH
ncbi:putative ATP-dependent helicase [Megalodesulfovibrio gigas DSM 1382 = ATCC 19364]|uniref:Putative ATP-dependent helicase n=2 Tax=Megalodesulfovibrio gigas TaxID=879 RepID=T2GD23_MEGG1|nr:putative ATP-dependent helicase [Megalodesulfovibrio gigas DSM 1382 = ATCC 19364]